MNFFFFFPGEDEMTIKRYKESVMKLLGLADDSRDTATAT